MYIPPGTRHSFRCGSTIGRVYNTLVPGGFDHGITANGTPALAAWQQIVGGRPPVPWNEGQQPPDDASW